ncbi:MAG: addiction module toxin, HicA family [Chloroflexi bacterium]|nr:addiction module toxin, HicA family [Chloroflexota bacterium]
MPKLPVLSARECVTALQRGGFYISRQKGSHITLRRDTPPGRVTVPNHKELKPGMLRGIIRQAELTVDEFIALLKD